MQRGKVTKLSVHEDYPVSMASHANGANLNCVAFNLDYIAGVDKQLAIEIVNLLSKCKKLRR